MNETRHGTTTAEPEPIEDGRGGTILGPRNLELERQNPDLLASWGPTASPSEPRHLSRNALADQVEEVRRQGGQAWGWLLSDTSAEGVVACERRLAHPAVEVA